MMNKPEMKFSSLQRDRLSILLMFLGFLLVLVTAFIFYPLEEAAMGTALLLTLFALSIAATFADQPMPVPLPWSGKLFWLTIIVGLLALPASVILFMRTGHGWLTGMIFPSLYLGQRVAKYQIGVYFARQQEHHQTQTG